MNETEKFLVVIALDAATLGLFWAIVWAIYTYLARVCGWRPSSVGVQTNAADIDLEAGGGRFLNPLRHTSGTRSDPEEHPFSLERDPHAPSSEQTEARNL